MSVEKATAQMAAPDKALDLAQDLEARMASIESRVSASIHQRAKIHEGDPKMHYAWVYISNDAQVEFKILGYRKAPKEVKTDWWDEDKQAHIRGDTILYQIPKEEYEALELINARKALVDIELPVAKFHKSGDEVGREHRTAVPTFTGRGR